MASQQRHERPHKRLDQGLKHGLPRWLPDLLGRVPVGHLASTDGLDTPHLVPVVFVWHQGAIYTPIDGKPKSGRPLKRLSNIAANPSVALLLDHYAADWSKLWWVRIDGQASVLESAHADNSEVFTTLTAKYPQYQTTDPSPSGTLIRITPTHVARWPSTFTGATDPARES